MRILSIHYFVRLSVGHILRYTNFIFIFIFIFLFFFIFVIFLDILSHIYEIWISITHFVRLSIPWFFCASLLMDVKYLKIQLQSQMFLFFLVYREEEDYKTYWYQSFINMFSHSLAKKRLIKSWWMKLAVSKLCFQKFWST